MFIFLGLGHHTQDSFFLFPSIRLMSYFLMAEKYSFV